MDATFKARARTLDMLGRQQIAGIPTAISELFKNAHDAYARTVEIDFYRSDGLFVLRDDGVGMTTEEFVDRWLTIATENRLEEKASGKPSPVAGMNERPVLGEKGIGRLAIATIARQVLVLTRPRSQGVPSELTAAFVNWRLFECTGLNLQDIHIPVRSFPGGTLPGREDIDDMVESFRRGHLHLRTAIGEERWSGSRRIWPCSRWIPSISTRIVAVRLWPTKGTARTSSSCPRPIGSWTISMGIQT
ncbi:ATP-binding protein [Candidatus Palauibacter sp.]|uniref:ATP-binding protein n=1 Tax=Candidatus Palauibacter sp. TaxID=3101350 RepID=UPI003B01935B